ncbi:YqjF family protein [Pedobacter sp. SYSU D00535]|uniref:YqjF family protein n=1 Tax=Pedobacter sp. SYSU D00535 TaxID=2810308 RepID=UPI001A97A2FF|nr:DUF2071 domain-containing protein [Pedobacter sp. SYSU D00535]
MKTVQEIFSVTDYRPWPLPVEEWTYYQEWNRALFLHWEVPAEQLRPLVPPQLELDTFNGATWVSLVAFTMEQIRPKGFPAVGLISNFDEINLRTYVQWGEKPGVYFLSIEAGKLLSAYTARVLSGLPYEPVSIRRRSGVVQRYTSVNRKRDFQLDASFRIGSKEIGKSALDLFLTEKYCLYMDNSGRLFRYEIHHKPWSLYQVEQLDLKVAYRMGGITLVGKPDVIHYSDGVKVIAWNKLRVDS